MATNKKILLQIYNYSYFAYGYAAIKTIAESFDLDVLIIPSNDKDKEHMLELLKQNKSIKNIYVMTRKQCRDNFALIKDKKLLDRLHFHLICKHKIIKNIKKCVPTKDYDEIFYCHELSDYPITFLKFLYKKAKFTCYGDGFGNFSNCITPHEYFKLIKPERAVAILPSDADDYFIVNKIPIVTTDKQYLIDTLVHMENSQPSLANFIQKLKDNYSNKEFNLFITSNLFDRGESDFQTEVDCNIEMIKKYCKPNSVVIIKKHPNEHTSKICEYKKILGNSYQILEFPEDLANTGVESLPSFLNICDKIINYSGTILLLYYLYQIKCIYPKDIYLKYYSQTFSSQTIYYSTIMDKIPYYRKGLIYSKY